MVGDRKVNTQEVSHSELHGVSDGLMGFRLDERQLKNSGSPSVTESYILVHHFDLKKYRNYRNRPLNTPAARV